MRAIAVDDEIYMLETLQEAVSASSDITKVDAFSVCSAALAYAAEKLDKTNINAAIRLTIVFFIVIYLLSCLICCLSLHLFATRYWLISHRNTCVNVSKKSTPICRNESIY